MHVCVLCVQPLARLGATVIGLEPGEPSIQVAKQHAARDPILQGRLTYECTTLEEYVGRAGTQQVDLVVASEVVEHVANPPLFAHNVCKLIKVLKGRLAYTYRAGRLLR